MRIIYYENNVRDVGFGSKTKKQFVSKLVTKKKSEMIELVFFIPYVCVFLPPINEMGLKKFITDEKTL